MGIVIDTDVWVLAEKAGSQLNLARWSHYGGAYMSAVTASELLVGVERANTAERRAQRGAFVENLLASIPVLEFSMQVARTHARMIAALSKKRDGWRARCADCRHGSASWFCTADAQRR